MTQKQTIQLFEEHKMVGTNCPYVAMASDSGVKRKTLAGDMKNLKQYDICRNSLN